MYSDTHTQRNIAKLNDELYEVHQIMTRNVQEVLGVGEKLDRKFIPLLFLHSARTFFFLLVNDFRQGLKNEFQTLFFIFIAYSFATLSDGGILCH